MTARVCALAWVALMLVAGPASVADERSPDELFTEARRLAFENEEPGSRGFPQP